MDRLIVLFVLVVVCWSTGSDAKTCVKNDLDRCVYYKKSTNFYCKQQWTQNNCANMCGLCDYNTVTRPPKSGEQLRQQLIKDEQVVCNGSDHYFCYFFEAGKSYYCKTSWCKQNCKWMCGVCKK